MYLKHLSLHGYKTFANRTEFLFDEGLTAVVGPNGSGKSNVADAIRWVLGEQSYSDLRVKKTEEMIFSGSSTRPRLGMAEVFLTLENLDSLTPEVIETAELQPEEVEGERKRIDPVTELLRSKPSEVSLGRRAFRDGQNEYFLNGIRVRLRDIHELLARWGLARNTYAVISQGLIDQALSLRPEERRALFEEAAGIGLYQSKRQNALDKLEETKLNLVRANDIINEIAPRLPSIARQAERAKNYDGVVSSLDEKLRTWYAFQWARAQQILQESVMHEKSAREELHNRRAEIQEISSRLTGLRRKGQELRAKLAEGRRSRAGIEGEHNSRAREIAVLDERLRSAAQRREDARTEIDALRESQRSQTAGLERAAIDVQRQESERELVSARLHEAESATAQAAAGAASAQSHESWLDQARALIRRLANLKNDFDQHRAMELSDEAQRLLEAESHHDEMAATTENLRAQVAELRTMLAIAERDLANARRGEESARANIAQLEAQVTSRETRVQGIEREIETLRLQRAELQSRLDESNRALAEIEQAAAPADVDLSNAEQSQLDYEEKESALRNGLAAFEDEHNRTVLDVERANADIARLETEIEDDLGSGRIVGARQPVVQETVEGGEPAPIEATIALNPDEPTQLRFLMAEEFVLLPVVSAIPEGLEKEIRKLRNQLRYMGVVNPNAPQEYEELKTRHGFLTAQAADATHAIESLHKAIAELDEIMRRKFEETFTAVNVEFGKFFTILFNGGSARLELTQPEDITQTGIDILAKPPGKRAAHLAMLSGGERALTAAALLFSILKVSPTPFCVMDEVDAALDEANVGRFRDVLKSLAEATQFIVITHNRVTMESADAVYGITMGEDGVSQAISLRLDAEEKIVEAGKSKVMREKKRAVSSKQQEVVGRR